MKSLIIIASILAVTLTMNSCGTAEGAANSQDLPKAVLEESFDNYRSAPITINSALIKKDILTLHVQYSGGCEEHVFKLIGLNNLTDGEHPERALMLYHDNKGDSCREQVDDILVFDIRSLADKGEVILKLQGFDQELPYKGN